MGDKKIYYRSDKLTVSYAPDICIHAAECVKGLPNVFDTSKKPWVNVNADNPDKIREVIDKCPSRALKYEINEKQIKTEKIKMEKTKVTVLTDGPLMVEGNVKVENKAGEVLRESEKMFLCRCGHSSNKPFCDGSHKKADFKAG